MKTEATKKKADKLPKNSVPGVPFTKDDPRINRNGRPKGKTIKEQVKEWLLNHPKDNEDFVKHFITKNRELAWQMLEGRPQQDIVSDGKAIPTPILNVLYNDSDKEDQQTLQENPGDSGGDISVEDNLDTSDSD